jgi:short-subunit dehydrogenase
MGNFLVTGASSGIGRAAALELDRIGHSVFAGVRKDEDVRVLEQASSDRLIPVILDLTDEFSIMAVKDEVDKKVGTHGLQGLVNNAGISVPGPFEFVPMELIREAYEVNLFGPISLTKTCLPLLRRGGGRIVNVGYAGCNLPAPLMSVVASSKAALKCFNDSLRLELERIGIDVIMVTPGAVRTPGIDKAETAAKTILKAMSTYAKKLYGQSMQSAYSRFFNERRKGLRPSTVSYVIVNALTTQYPKKNYLIGKEAKVERFFNRFMPNPIIEMIAKSMFCLDCEEKILQEETFEDPATSEKDAKKTTASK